MASFILFAIRTEDSADHSVSGRKGKKECGQGNCCEVGTIKGKASEGSRAVVLNGSVPQISCILPLVVVQ